MNKDIWNIKQSEEKEARRQCTKKEFDQWVHRVCKDFCNSTGYEVTNRSTFGYYWLIGYRDTNGVLHDSYRYYPETDDNGIYARFDRSSVILIITADYVSIMNAKTGKFGSAKLRPGDEFNLNIAVAFAWARYCNIPIPTATFSVDKLVPGDKFKMWDSVHGWMTCVFISKNETVDDEYIVKFTFPEKHIECSRYDSVKINQNNCEYI